MKKIGDDLPILFGDYRLAEYMIRKSNGKKKMLGTNDKVRMLLVHVLHDYGIHLSGYTNLFDLEGNAIDVEVNYITIMDNFPVENEPIFKQLYGYEHTKIDIGLVSKSDKHAEGRDFAVSFMYNLDNGECILNKHVYGSCTPIELFNDFKSMMSFINKSESCYDAILNCERVEQ